MYFIKVLHRLIYKIDQMFDSLTRLPHELGISSTIENSKKCNIQVNTIRTTIELRECFIKLRRIKTNPSVNNESSVNAAGGAPKRVGLHVLPDQRSCTKNKEETNSTKPQKHSRIVKATATNNSIESKKYENNQPTLHEPNTQKGCKQLMVKVKRLDLNKMLNYTTEKMANLSTMNGTVTKPNTRNKRISYKPKEFKPFCKCGCRVALQDQSTSHNISKKANESTQLLNSTKKVIVRLKRTPIAKTKTLKENTKLQMACKKVLTKPNPVRNATNAKQPIKEKKVEKRTRRALDLTKFSPVRNSTVLGNDHDTISELMQKDKSQNDTKDNTKEDNLSLKNSTTEENRKSKSLTNKPDLIEQLLFTDDEDEDEQANQEAHISAKVLPNEQQTIENRTNTTHKFFHRVPATELRPKKVSIFEFLSQSDTSETEVAKHDDPAADIINKLISEGRVRVATNHKGTGRPTLKRVRKKPVIGNKKKSKIKMTKKIYGANTNKFDALKGIPENANTEKSLQREPVQQFVDEDYHSNDAHFDEPINEYQNDAGFSRLARSVLLQQANKKNEVIRKHDAFEQRRLLEAARKFVSTPAAAHRKNESLPDMSPIHKLSTTQRPACPSPWRIDEDLHLPGVFNFSKNTSYLPSFSSDYIPPTPKKLHKNTHVYMDALVPADPTATSSIPNNNNSNNDSNGGSSYDSSRSANNSNAENMPPPAASTPAATSVLNNDENADIFNLRQLPNPRRTLAHRSPLKAINIIEVVTLPPWKKPVNNDIEKSNARKSTNTASDKNDDTQHNVDDLFGFDELINEDSSDVDASLNAIDATKSSRQSIKRELHTKLKNLKKWRPKNVHQPVHQVPVKPIRLFDEDEGRPKQRLIKEMLCSTMINQSKALPERHQQEQSPENNAAVKESQPIETDFFNEYEPETTLNEKQPRRTYARPIKRKRKARKNVRFFDSDASSTDSDDEEEQQKELKKVQQKKKRLEDKDNPVLESFVNEFNSMCKEVDNYELVVE